MIKEIKNFEDFSKELYDLDLNDVIKFKDTEKITEIRCVPGGWIYTFTDKSTQSMTSTFIPYDEEFKEVCE
jgi:hypothetical protein